MDELQSGRPRGVMEVGKGWDVLMLVPSIENVSDGSDEALHSNMASLEDALQQTRSIPATTLGSMGIQLSLLQTCCRVSAWGVYMRLDRSIPGIMCSTGLGCRSCGGWEQRSPRMLSSCFRPLLPRPG